MTDKKKSEQAIAAFAISLSKVVVAMQLLGSLPSVGDEATATFFKSLRNDVADFLTSIDGLIEADASEQAKAV